MNQTAKQLIIATLCAVGLLAAIGWGALKLMSSPAEAAELDPAQRERAVAFLDALDAGRYDEAQSMLAPAAAEALKGQLETIWTTLPKQVGERKSRSEPRGESVGGTKVVTMTLEHSLLSLDARVHFDDELRIDGFRVVPASKPAEPVSIESNADFSETEVEVGDLPATLTLPRKGESPFPAVFLVHGSGPHDRDETIGPNRPFRDLAHGLAERGVAVLRYEKRTHAKPETFAPTATLEDEVINDAAAAASLLAKTDGIDTRRIALVGHSLGAMAAPRIIERAPELAGAVLLAGNSRPLQTLVVEQISYLAQLDGSVSEEEQAQIDEVTAQRDALDAMAAGGATPESLLLGLSEPYWRDLLAYDPAQVARGQTLPMLVLQGERDYQVTLDGDFARWKTALAERDNVSFKSYPRLNHLFIAGEGTPGPQEYMEEGKVDPTVMDDITRFVKAL